MEKLKRYRTILSPDFSMYLEMAPVMQLYNVFCNHWCGAYFSGKGIRVIPTVSWGDENTFDFCFDRIPKGSTVAVSTYMVSAHGSHADQKEFFMKGYREMLRRIEPEQIICYNEPFPEMEGNIVFIDYELSSWKYQNEDYTPSQYLTYILGERPLPANSKIRIKSGHILRESPFNKGMGSANGGPWTPKKPDDERFIGEPGEIKPSRAGGKRGGYSRLTKIGDDGKAVSEWHGKVFGIWPKLRKTPDAPFQMLISQVLIENMEATKKWCDNADEVLEYVIDGDRLRDIITKVEVTDRTI